MLAGVSLTGLPDDHFLLRFGVLLLDPLLVVSRQLGILLHDVDIVLLLVNIILLNERLAPADLIQAMKHSLFHLALLRVNHD